MKEEFDDKTFLVTSDTGTETSGTDDEPAQSLVDWEMETGVTITVIPPPIRTDRPILTTLQYRRLFTSGVLNVVIGVLSIITAVWAIIWKSMVLSTSSSLLSFNTHWLTVIHLFSGVANMLCARQASPNTARLNAEAWGVTLATPIAIYSAIVGLGVVIADLVNICFLVQGYSPGSSLQRSLIHGRWALLIYNGIDIACNFAACLISVSVLPVLSDISNKQWTRPVKFRRPRLLIACGCTLIVVNLLNLILYIVSIVWLHRTENFKIRLILYSTVDQPVAIITAAIVGVMLVLYITGRLPGNSNLALTAIFALSVITILPTIEYTFRMFIMLNSGSITPKYASFGLNKVILSVGLFLNYFNLVVLILIGICIIQVMYDNKHGIYHKILYPASRTIRLLHSTLPFILLGGGLIFLIIDIIETQEKSILQLFQSSDPRVPLLLIISGVVAFLAMKETAMRGFALVVLFNMLLWCSNKMLFQVVTYIFLSYNVYFNRDMCELFWDKSIPFETHCEIVITQANALIHFFAALIGLLLITISIFFACIIIRVIGILRAQVGELRIDAVQRQNRLEKILIACGSFLIWIGGLGMLMLIWRRLSISGGAAERGVLRHIHMLIYPACYLIIVISQGVVQIFLARRSLLRCPLGLLTLIVMHTLRIVVNFISLDMYLVGFLDVWAIILVLAKALNTAISFVSLVCCMSLWSMSKSEDILAQPTNNNQERPVLE